MESVAPLARERGFTPRGNSSQIFGYCPADVFCLGHIELSLRAYVPELQSRNVIQRRTAIRTRTETVL